MELEQREFGMDTLWILKSSDSFLVIRQRCFEEAEEDARATASLKHIRCYDVNSR